MITLKKLKLSCMSATEKVQSRQSLTTETKLSNLTKKRMYPKTYSNSDTNLKMYSRNCKKFIVKVEKEKEFSKRLRKSQMWKWLKQYVGGKKCRKWNKTLRDKNNMKIKHSTIYWKEIGLRKNKSSSKDKEKTKRKSDRTNFWKNWKS